MCAARKETLTGEPNRGGRPRTLREEHVLALKEIVAEQPGATLEVVTQLLAERCGVKVCSLTVRRALQDAGVVRVKPTRRAVEGGPPAKPGRYGYTPAHRREAAGSGYGCCLTDAQWALVADLFEHRAGGRGMPPQLDRRTLVDACCYVLRTGCAWRLLPRSFPAWPTVYKSFSRWAAQGVFESMQDRLRQQWRERLGRHAQPSAAVLDSQSTRYSPQGGEAGFDAGKKVKGRKRHLVVDTLGLLLAVTVSAASVQDRDGAPAVVALACAKVPSLKVLFVDGAYRAVHALRRCRPPMAWTYRWCATPAMAMLMCCWTRTLPRHLRWSPRASCLCQCAGWSSVLTPGASAAAVSSCITTARSPSPPHGCGLLRPRSSCAGWPSPVDSVYTH